MLGMPGCLMPMGASYVGHVRVLDAHGGCPMLGMPRHLCDELVGRPDLEMGTNTKKVMSAHDFP